MLVGILDATRVDKVVQVANRCVMSTLIIYAMYIIIRCQLPFSFNVENLYSTVRFRASTFRNLTFFETCQKGHGIDGVFEVAKTTCNVHKGTAIFVGCDFKSFTVTKSLVKHYLAEIRYIFYLQSSVQ